MLTGLHGRCTACPFYLLTCSLRAGPAGTHRSSKRKGLAFRALRFFESSYAVGQATRLRSSPGPPQAAFNRSVTASGETCGNVGAVVVKVAASGGLSVACPFDAAFVARWHPRYDELTDDEFEYLRLINAVARQISAGPSSTISPTLREIFSWLRPAILAWHFVQVDRFDQLYAPAFRAGVPSPKVPASQAKLRELLKPPGLGVPTATALLHFMHPNQLPIMIKATAEELYRGGCIKPCRATLSKTAQAPDCRPNCA
jgi:hypothetical protein